MLSLGESFSLRVAWQPRHGLSLCCLSAAFCCCSWRVRPVNTLGGAAGMLANYSSRGAAPFAATYRPQQVRPHMKTVLILNLGRVPLPLIYNIMGNEIYYTV